MTTPGPVHTESEAHPWRIDIPDHPGREDSPEYRASRTRMNAMAAESSGLIYGSGPYQDHHGGSLWLKDASGWFMVRNLAGIEWSAQFCADPAKVDLLRQNARRLYALVAPEIAQELDPGGLLALTDPEPGGIHHYPTPIADIQLFKYDDFQLWVTDEEGNPAAVAPVSRRGSGDACVHVLYATPGSRLARRAAQARRDEVPLILGPDHPIPCRRTSTSRRRRPTAPTGS